MQNSEVPGSTGPKAPLSKPFLRYCSQLCHLDGSPCWDCFSLLRSYQAWSNQLTCDKDPDIRQISRPKTAGTKLPKGPIRRDEGDFLTLQEGPRKGLSPVLPRALGERGGSVVECRTPEREVGGSKPTAAVLCPWARHFTPRKYWLITQEAMAPSRHDWKIVDWDVKPQHKQTNKQNPEPLQEHIDLVTSIAKVMCFSHTWSSHCPSI